MSQPMPSVTYSFAQWLHGLGLRTVAYRLLDQPATRCVASDTCSIGKLTDLVATHGATRTVIIQLPQDRLLQIDDLTPEQVARAVAGAFGDATPAGIVQTSSRSAQAWFRVAHRPEPTWTRAFCGLIGGRANTQPNGSVRCPGSINWKPEHGPRFPVVDLTHDHPRVGILACPAAAEPAARALPLFAARRARRRPVTQPTAMPPREQVVISSGPLTPPPGIPCFPNYGNAPAQGDRSGRDFRVVMTALTSPDVGRRWQAHPEALAAWLHGVSPKAQERNDGGAYAWRTVQAALARVRQNEAAR